MLAGSVSFARLVFGLLERPMPALATLLNYFCRNRASKKLSALGLSDENHRLGYKAGRIMLVESKELIVVEKASIAPKAPFSEPSSDR